MRRGDDWASFIIYLPGDGELSFTFYLAVMKKAKYFYNGLLSPQASGFTICKIGVLCTIQNCHAYL